MKKLILFSITVFVLQLSAIKTEAASLWLYCGDGTGLTCDGVSEYTLRGVDFVNVSGVEVEIQYNSGSLKSPQIIKGPLLRPATGVNNPNFSSSSLKITGGSLPPFLNGTDVLATIKFTPAGTAPGNVSILTSKLRSGKTGEMMQYSIKNPADFISEARAREDERLRLEADKAAKIEEEKRIAAEKAAKDAEAARIASEKAAQDKADAEKAAKDAEEIRIAAEKAEAARIAADKAAQDAEAARIASEKAAQDKAAADERARVAAAAAVAARANAAGASVSAVGSASIGTITLPADQLASTERKTEYQPLVTDLRGDMTLPLSGSGSTTQAAAVQPSAKDKPQENKSVSYKSVLQLFREYKGEKSVKALLSLFAEGAVPAFTQNPPVALSDGVTPVKLIFTLRQGGNETPKFIFQGASVQQMNNEGEGQLTWTIDALPKKGVHEAKLTVIDGQNIIEFPLVVAPPVGPLVPKAQKFTEADFNLYLSKPAGFDLNKDQKFDTLDDYIFTANYIVAMKIKPEKLKKDESKPVEQGEVKVKEPQKTKEEKMKKVPSR